MRTRSPTQLDAGLMPVGYSCQVMHRQKWFQVAVLASSLAIIVAARGEDWPQWRGPNRDGAWVEAGVSESFPAGGLPVTWRAAVGQGWSSPVVAQGRAYVTDVQLTGRAARERVLCFDAASGKAIWVHEYAVNYPDWALNPEAGGGPRATPIARDRRLFALGAMGDLICLDAVSGTVIWEKSLAKEYQVM